MSWLSRILKPSANPEAEQPPSQSSSPKKHAGDVNEAQVLEGLIEWVTGNSPMTRDEIDADAHAYDSGYFSSSKAMQLIAWIEDSYGVAVTEFELIGRLSSLGSLSRHIAKAATAQTSQSSKRPLGVLLDELDHQGQVDAKVVAAKHRMGLGFEMPVPDLFAKIFEQSRKMAPTQRQN